MSVHSEIDPKCSSDGDTKSLSQRIRECRALVGIIKEEKVEEDVVQYERSSQEELTLSQKFQKLREIIGTIKVEKDDKNESVKIYEITSENLECDYCGKQFKHKQSIKQHFTKIHINQNCQKFQCDFDGKIFYNKYKLRNHMRVHFKSIQCKICQQKVNFVSFYHHMKYFHSTEPRLKCKICSKTFKTLKNLQNHEKTHDKKLSCEICSQKFHMLGRLNTHRRQYHENSKSYKCETCDRKFNRKEHLKSHLKVHLKKTLKSVCNVTIQRAAYLI